MMGKDDKFRWWNPLDYLAELGGVFTTPIENVIECCEKAHEEEEAKEKEKDDVRNREGHRRGTV